jgi:hypothetical protein
MKKTITLSLIIALFVGMSASISAANVTIRFKAPADWTSVYFYIYGTNNSLLGGWPGTAVTKDADGFYSLTYDNTGITTANGIFNNNAGQQTASFDVLTTSCWEAKTLSGTEYSVGVVTCPNVIPQPVTVRFKAPVGWTDAYFYIWGTNNSLVGGWPGTKMTLGTDGFYTGTFDKTGITAANGIFNNNAGVQTASVDVLAGGCWETGALSGTEYTVTAANCPTTGISKLTETSISVYPNPINNKLNFATPEDISWVNINSVTGENVMSVSSLATSGVVDVSVLKAGIYFVNIHFVNGKQHTEKIIKL